MTFRARFLCCAVFCLSFLLSVSAFSQISEQVTYLFTGASGADPRTNLVLGPGGKYYGMTTSGGFAAKPCGQVGCGVVFELSPKAKGSWGYHRLHLFRGGSDGFAPYGNIVFDAAGNLYGTTSSGGASGLGTVFRLTPGSNNVWTETLIHSFSGTDADGDGATPRAGLIEDAKGNLYGTTYGGGASNNGTVFEVTPNSDGSWSETVLYSFLGGKNDGAAPSAEVAFDAQGNLYGTTSYGGTKLFGIVFELTPAGGEWDESELYSFPGQDLAAALAPVWIASNGTVYGTACGQFPNQGAVFELAKSAGGWKEKTLHTFGSSGDGWCPVSGLTADASGNLYGTTTFGGSTDNGIVYEMLRGTGGGWTEKTIYSFAGGGDGVSPEAGVTVSGSTLYGTTTAGGSGNFGAVYEITQ